MPSKRAMEAVKEEFPSISPVGLERTAALLDRLAAEAVRETLRRCADELEECDDHTWIDMSDIWRARSEGE